MRYTYVQQFTLLDSLWRTTLAAAAADKLYKAEYHGSGTFTITKPKRKAHKKRQTRVKNPQRGARR